jgi:malate synthase
VLWEWLHKAGTFTEDDPDSGVKAGDALTDEMFAQLLEQEHAKLLRADSNDVHDDSKTTTLPIARAIVEAYVLEPVKAPWYIDLLNLNLNVTDLSVVEERIRRFLDEFGRDGTRITRNLDFDIQH